MIKAGNISETIFDFDLQVYDANQISLANSKRDKRLLKKVLIGQEIQ